jgi:hypothetical protein
MRRILLGLFGGLLLSTLWAGPATPAHAQDPTLYANRAADLSIGKYYYYPYYYFPHNYWPAQGPQWPEKMGEGYVRPPAYMAYPAFREPHWRYDLFQPAPYYRGFHFWLDQF